MSVATVAAPTAAEPRSRARGEERAPRRFPVENAALFVLSAILYMAAADYIVLHLHYMNGDAYSRVANAEYVIGSRDPHLGAIGFVWPPLPSFVDIPILLLQKWFPFLATSGFAGSVEAALFSAGTVVLLNIALRRAGVMMPIRWAVLAAWVANPMTALYATEGMSEAPFIFFVVASISLFVLWTETKRSLHLALLGCAVGLGTLCRDEFAVLAVAIGVGIVFCSVGRGVSRRELETRALLYAMPALFFIGLWIGAMWVLMHDPLYFAHSSYGNAAQSTATGDFGQSPSLHLSTWSDAAGYVLTQSVMLFPLVVVVLAALGFRTVAGRDRRPAIVLAAMAFPVALVDVWLLHAHQLNLLLRYQIYVIPYAMMVGIYLLRQVRRLRPRHASSVAILLVLLVALSDLSSMQAMMSPANAREESVAVQAVSHDVSTGDIQANYDPDQEGAMLSQAVAAADADHGLIAMDAFMGFRIFMTAPDRSLYVVTSDESFEAAINQPDVYHVEYLLVPQPVGEGTLDHINAIYPTLWQNGGGFAVKVADIGGSAHWRLYRVLGPTGRG